MDKEAQFREIIEKNADRIYRICSYYFRDGADKDDAFQDSLVRIWENLASFRNRSLISTWIYRVTVNTCLTFIRKDKSRKQIFEPLISPSLVNKPEDPSGDAQKDRLHRTCRGVSEKSQATSFIHESIRLVDRYSIADHPGHRGRLDRLLFIPEIF
jgi:RNA polymerase sigma-70 factor (ECF subfamily)